MADPFNPPIYKEIVVTGKYKYTKIADVRHVHDGAKVYIEFRVECRTSVKRDRVARQLWETAASIEQGVKYGTFRVHEEQDERRKNWHASAEASGKFFGWKAKAGGGGGGAHVHVTGDSTRQEAVENLSEHNKMATALENNTVDQYIEDSFKAQTVRVEVVGNNNAANQLEVYQVEYHMGSESRSTFSYLVVGDGRVPKPTPVEMIVKVAPLYRTVTRVQMKRNNQNWYALQADAEGCPNYRNGGFEIRHQAFPRYEESHGVGSKFRVLTEPVTMLIGGKEYKTVGLIGGYQTDANKSNLRYLQYCVDDPNWKRDKKLFVEEMEGVHKLGYIIPPYMDNAQPSNDVCLVLRRRATCGHHMSSKDIDHPHDQNISNAIAIGYAWWA
mmetsp:Transcript_23455/g.65856  ORF Transcript_23455/g.65856 Transcript_23455/m.65856 type:complete len:385 (+) Transcript_23455:123-1277(+)|eukprot:CAMPEP_0119131976 /NCGR_PEP_ID=MMETSP1310-20130426/11072_1 /TAXON_ID=464262 /ORGANISM="Genus nov. species nov., Strain RCC2339" /LENGTH=384 /DNA_ID=CAMNT_0007122579 /DNA_START=123 /DNA_END=1277 /DNA_ORIENTATION=-